MIDNALGRAVATVALGGAALALVVFVVALFGPVRTNPDFATIRRPFAFAAAASFVTLAVLGWIATAGWLSEPFGILVAVALLALAGRPWSKLTRRMAAERDARNTDSN